MTGKELQEIENRSVSGTKEDLIFIANAKQDIPNLIAEIKRLKKNIKPVANSRLHQWRGSGFIRIRK